MVTKRTEGEGVGGLLNRQNLLRMTKFVFPKRRFWAVERHTWDMVVSNKIVGHLLTPTKSGDLYGEQVAAGHK